MGESTARAGTFTRKGAKSLPNAEIRCRNLNCADSDPSRVSCQIGKTKCGNNYMCREQSKNPQRAIGDWKISESRWRRNADAGIALRPVSPYKIAQALFRNLRCV